MLRLDKTVTEIAAVVDGVVEGDGGVMITGLAGIREAGPGDLTFAIDEKYMLEIDRTGASAVLVQRGAERASGMPTLVKVDDVARAWEILIDRVKPEPVAIERVVDGLAKIGENVSIGENAAVMAFAAVMDGASLGDGTTVYPFAYVGHGARLGKDCLIYPGAVIRERVVIGDRVLIQPGAVIGSDGFGYHEKNGKLIKQEQSGTVVIEDDVEIGANVTIDRARFSETRIGSGSKIDNLVQIAHNVVLGRDSILVSQVGVAGSAHLGRGIRIGGQAGVNGHVTVGDYVVVAARAGVTKDTPANRVVYGNPAGNRMEKQREEVSLRRLPALLETVKILSKRVERLEAQSEND